MGAESASAGDALDPEPCLSGVSHMHAKPITPTRTDVLRGWTVPGALLSLILLLAGCGEEHPQSSINPHSDFAEIIHSLYVSIFWWTMLILAVVWVLLAYVLVKFRARPGDPKPKQIRGHMGLEIGWTVGPALIVVAIAIPTIQAVFATQRPLSEDALMVEVTGHQFWWEFHYPEEGVTTANELRLPVDRPVSLRLGSTDVIHSFWVPKLGGKRDVNPVVAVPDGQEPKYNWLFFTPNQTGLYMGQCAEFCGEAHAFMAMRVLVETEDEFQGWIQEWQALAPPDEDPRVALGQDIFLNQSTCVACHAIEGTSAVGLLGPNLTLFGQRTTLAAGIRENNQENLVSWIRDPHGMKPGAAMPGTTYPGGNWPATNLSDDQVEAVAAYLLSLK